MLEFGNTFLSVCIYVTMKSACFIRLIQAFSSSNEGRSLSAMTASGHGSGLLCGMPGEAVV